MFRLDAAIIVMYTKAEIAALIEVSGLFNFLVLCPLSVSLYLNTVIFLFWQANTYKIP